MTTEQKHVNENDNAANAASDSDIAQMEAIREAVSAGMTLKDAHGISSEMMDGLYAHAYDFYGKGKLDQAETFFRFLCLYDFYNIDYIMGLAAVCQMKKQYEKAIGLYAVAFGLSKNDYRPMFFTGQCHLFDRKAAKARLCFELVVKHTDDEAFRNKAQVYLDVLAKTGASSTTGATEQPQEPER
ncbi:type III secretion system translocator chaperone SicA [Oxalobacteraceae bacterium CAVE-383]|nr:type III secretion system translocator chaperone SicA [Oxalobacteraceae bacterium CAVE-383]